MRLRSSRSVDLWFAAFSLSLLVFLINPALILLGDLTFRTPGQSWLILVALSASMTLILALPFGLFSLQTRRIATAVYQSAFLVLFLVSVFYPEGGRRLDGGAVTNQSFQSLFATYSAYLLFAIVLIALALKQQQIVRGLSTISLVAGLAVLAYVLISNPPTQLDRSQQPPQIAYGTENNVIFILADMLQGSAVEQTIIAYPELREGLSGFSAYTRSIAPFPFTNYTLPSILSGRLYAADPQEGYLENLRAAQQDSFIVDAEASGYETIAIGMKELPARENQFSYAATDDPPFIAALLVDLGITRFSKLTNLLKDLAPQTKLLVSLKQESLSLLKQLKLAEVGHHPKTLIFQHNFIPHSPNLFSATDPSTTFSNWTPKPRTPENYLDETRFFLLQLIGLMDRLKTLGVYQDALIAIVGDHGHFVGTQPELYSFAPGAEDFEGWEQGTWARAAAMYNAAILLKLPGANGPLQANHSPLAVTDIRPVIDLYLADHDSRKIVERLDVPANRQNRVVVFKEDISTNPYGVADDHEVLEFTGNVSQLPRIFVRQTPSLGPMYAGVETRPVNHLMDGNWVEGKEGAWLRNRTARIHFTPHDFDQGRFCLAVTARPLVTAEHARQRVTLTMNGTELGTMTFTEPSETVLLELPGIINLSEELPVVLEFLPLDAVSPAELGLWSTSFPISIYVTALSFPKDCRSPS